MAIEAEPTVSDFIHLATMLREQMHATLSRSDVLRGLIWPMSITGTLMLALAYTKAPDWAIGIAAGLFVLFAVLYALSYTFCLFKDRDALRSETYSLNKMAIEHGILGDSIRGVLTDTPMKKALPSAHNVVDAEK